MAELQLNQLELSLSLLRRIIPNYFPSLFELVGIPIGALYLRILSWAKHEGYLTLKKEYASLDALEVALVQNSSHLSTLNEEQLKLYKYNFNFDKDFNKLIGIQ
jgi:hypothetical protein